MTTRVARRVPSCAIAVAAIATQGRLAHADDMASVHIELHGPAECPDGAAFFADIHSRTSRVRLSAPGQPVDVALLVTIEDRSDRLFDGELELETTSGSSSRRRLSGETCIAVESGLALVAALAIDPDASTGAVPQGVSRPPAAAPSPPPAPPPPAPRMMPAHIVQPAPSLPAAAVSPTVRTTRGVSDSGPDERSSLAYSPSPPPPPTPAAPPKASVPARWRTSAGVYGGFLGVSAPGLVADGAIFGDLLLDRSSVLSPSFHLAAHRTLESTDSLGGSGRGSFAWTYARAEVCPLRLTFASPFALRPCAFFDLGLLSADGSGEAPAKSPVEPWAAAGGLVRLDWTLPLSTRWAVVLDAEGGVLLPIVRKSFGFDNSTTRYEAPILAGTAALGAGVRFP